MERQLQVHRQIERFMGNVRKIGRNNYTSAILRARILSLKELWTRFNDDHAILEAAATDSIKMTVSYFSDNIYECTEDTFNSTLDRLSAILEELEPFPGPNRSIASSHTRQSHSVINLSRLPAIQLPPFDGLEAEWETFRDRFVAVILENEELSDFSRMHYLVTFLRGRALECISGLAVSAANFNVAWRALKDRYDNKRRLLSVHLSNLLNLPRLSRESPNDLQSLRSKVRLTIASLSNLQRAPADLWNDFLVHIVVQHLDITTRRAWTLRTPESHDPQSYDDLDRFLVERIRALEDISHESQRAPTSRGSGTTRVHNASIASITVNKCSVCNARHYFSSCPRFLSGNLKLRRELVQRHRRYFNCLSPKHSVNDCSSRFSCNICHQRHHTLLHDPSARTQGSLPNPTALAPESTDRRDVASSSLVAATRAGRRAPVLLATARVRVFGAGGRSAVIRALLDQGSEVSLASRRLVQLLKAKRLRASTSIRAVGDVSAGDVQYAAQVDISSRNSPSPSYTIVALVLKSLSSYAPRHYIDLNHYSHLSGLTWADPDPCSKEPIDLIIGAELYADILLEGVRRGSVGQPIAQQTAFGWVISGPMENSGTGEVPKRRLIQIDASNDFVSSFHCLDSLDYNLRRFWEVEDVPHLSIRTPDEERCEAHFVSTHSRDQSGRYRVRLPFRTTDPINIGSSRFRAEQCMKSLYRRFQSNPTLRQTYSEFMRDYQSLGHMRRATASADHRKPVVYTPHHPVFRAHSLTSSLRVVFIASSLTNNGTSLNDHLFPGPKLQSDLSAVLLRWRNYQFVYCADITKMFRQILVDERDLDFQRILWSESTNEQPADFQLLTATYGMASAPFLALRVIQQLQEDEGHNFPLASQILKTNIYVDDILFGGDSVEKAMIARDQLISLLAKGCFPLRKWSGNSPALLADMPEENCGLACSKDLADDDRIRVLGIKWIPSEDVFGFSVCLPEQIPRSKRSILSVIARLYDPLGWVTPIIIAAKIFLQTLWRHKLDWDEPIANDLLAQWHRIYESFSTLNNLRLTRWTGFSSNIKYIELHGFADASNKAYAAVVYCKVVPVSEIATVTLLIGKSKVAPIKMLSVPRLELAAAVLLTRVLELVRCSLSFQKVECYCWSDSQVVLTWISQHPSRWKPFVAHRVNDIQTRLPNAHWRHVATSDNPADCASRGLLGDDLQCHSLW